MKILYHIWYPDSVGADRWIYEGWRDAFLDLGHEFFELTISDDLKQKIEEIKPDIFMTEMVLLDFKKDVSILQNARRKGTKIFLWVYWPPEQELQDAKTFLEEEDVADIYFGEREPEGMGDFSQKTEKKYYVIPHAANKRLHFPTNQVEKYRYDIVYLGAYLPKKKQFFQEVLLPLTKKYRVGIFGPQWTLKDRALGGLQKVCRTIDFQTGVKIFNKLRVTIPPREENQLYSSVKIALNFHERESDGSQPHYILNQRTFKIPACGGFEICDWVPALRKYFTEKEVVMAKTKADWFAKIDYYLKNENDRKIIQEKGTRKALQEHTYHNRVQYLLQLYQSL